MDVLLEKIRQKIIDYIYVVSKQPVLYRDLLHANCLYNEGMHVDAGKLNFKRIIWRAYVAYGLMCFIVLTPLTFLTHTVFTKIDFHLSLISSVVVTACICMGFGVFNAWVRRAMTKRLIQKAWLVHFPYFPYEKYNQKVEIIYQKSIKEEVPRRDLEQYILNQLLKDK